MKSQLLYACFLSLATLCSCKNNPASHLQTRQNPNYDYKIDAPQGWSMYDTTIQNLKCRFIIGPDSLDSDKPRVNIVIASMGGSEIDDFTRQNINYLKETMQETVLLERGAINISSIDARWVTYTREQNGVVRDMINYIIPFRGFAYMVTCGTNKGSIKKYRSIFDQIARSFRP